MNRTTSYAGDRTTMMVTVSHREYQAIPVLTRDGVAFLGMVLPEFMKVDRVLLPFTQIHNHLPKRKLGAFAFDRVAETPGHLGASSSSGS